ncbi:MAG TPA: hypothetical protein VN705_24205 [Steroidobacteraceae bacterium]|nr:hypothetical protein [Steroidobacteraceae bacterium]
MTYPDRVGSERRAALAARRRPARIENLQRSGIVVVGTDVDGSAADSQRAREQPAIGGLEEKQERAEIDGERVSQQPFGLDNDRAANVLAVVRVIVGCVAKLVEQDRFPHGPGEGESERDGLGGARAECECHDHGRVCKESLSPLHEDPLLRRLVGCSSIRRPLPDAWQFMSKQFRRCGKVT